MLPSALANIALGYQLVWSQQRQNTGVLLFIAARPETPVDGAHLLRILAQAWSRHSPRLILLVQSARLLAEVLAHAEPGGPWIGVQHSLLDDPEVATQLQRALARGVHLVWRGEPGQHPTAQDASCFAHQVLALSAGEALVALRASLQPSAGAPATLARASPVLADQIYEGVASRILVEHCLDQQKVWGVAGWPADDVLHGYHNQQIQPSALVIARLVEATDADLALERIEHILAEEPVLVYRFLRHANSAALGMRTGIDSLRHAMMVLGLSNFKRWLLEQLPQATSDRNLQPVRTAMVVRARLMELLLDAGEEDKLRSEVLLCGLLSQIDLLLGEPIAAALQRFPISERITDAILANTGPYAPFLEIATAMEHPASDDVASLCETHELDRGEVNRALLKALAQSHGAPVR